MSDPLLQLARNPTARRLVKRAGLPIPMPQSLTRPDGPYVERPLEQKSVLVGGEGDLLSVIANTVIGAGAGALATGDPAEAAFAEPGDAHGRLAPRVDEATGDQHLHGLVFDASKLDTPEALRGLYDFFHQWLSSLDRCGRVVLLGRPADTASSAQQASARYALEGFIRSVAKEIGKKGATANLIVVEDGAESRTAAVLRFFLSPASAFVSAQPLRVSSRATYDGHSPWVQSLQGKVALVTGAARGIGAAIAERLALEGAHVVCLDRPEDGERVGETARKIGGSALLVDVSSAEAPATISDALERQHGGVDLVVHNAGVTRDKTLARMRPEQWDQTLGINLGAIQRINERLVDGEALREQGRVVCLSSVAGIAGNVGQTNYAASKAGLIGYIRFLAPELAERGITVNAVAPGFIDTRMTAAIPFVIREAGRRLSALGQGGRPEDVANAITFLCSPGAGGVTGNVLRICGGALIGA
jgi:3-oxoacyl-[acyl-carrier protein] reductase